MQCRGLPRRSASAASRARLFVEKLTIAKNSIAAIINATHKISNIELVLPLPDAKIFPEVFVSVISVEFVEVCQARQQDHSRQERCVQMMVFSTPTKVLR